MATTGDRLLRLSGEALQKLKSDHEQFLEAYEKPTQIYRFLRARHSLKPLFLQRNLSYMRMHRNLSQVKRKRKRKLRVNDLLEHTKDNSSDFATEIKSDNHLQISITGLEAGIEFSQLPVETNGVDSQSTNQNEASKSHDHQMIEIEILLYSFSQPSAEALLSGHKNSFRCTSLSLGKRLIHYNTSENGKSTNYSFSPLLIPESSLTWKHRQGPGGTQMIVFRASQYVPSNDTLKIKKSPGHKNDRKSASGGKGVLYPSGTASKGDSSSSRDDDAATALSNRGELLAKLSQTCTKRAPEPTSNSKLKTRDACVMTDIRFGTEAISELSPIYQSQINSISPPITNQSNTTIPLHQNGFAPKASSLLDRSRSSSPFISRHDKSTSPLIPKLALRNGILNGLSSMNGYAAPTVTSIRQNISKRKRTKRKAIPSKRWENSENRSTIMKSLQSSSPMAPQTNLTQSVEKLEQEEQKQLGSGKRGARSFLVSIPRAQINDKLLAPSTQSSLPKTNGEHKSVGRVPGQRRRTEIQLLLDGDKPRGQRMSADEVPKFIAEDVTSWSTMTSEKASWLGSSTRKITPVDHYSCPFPLSPKRPSSIASTSSLTMINNRKRSHSEEDSESCSVTSPKLPLPKCSRQLSPSDHNNTFKKIPEPLSPSSLGIRKDTIITDGEAGSCQLRDTNSSIHSARNTCNLYVQSNEVFCAELVVFDSRGDCLLSDGEYAVLMHKCLEEEETEPSDLLMFEPLTWSSVFSAPAQSDISPKKSKNLLLKFTLSWTDGPPQHLLCSNLDTALDLSKIRDSYYPSRSPNSLAISATLPLATGATNPRDLGMFTATENGNTMKVLPHIDSQDPQKALVEANLVPCSQDTPSLQKEKIFFNFLYGTNSLQQTECKEDLCCPWCFVPCIHFYSLLKHLSLCHPRFQFTYSPGAQRAKVINVHVNKLYGTTSSIERDPGEKDSMRLLSRKSRPAKAISCTSVLVDRSFNVQEDLSEFMNDGSWRRGYNTNRMYYHSNSSLPMLENEIKVDSEAEESALEWQKICSQKMLDEFTDVNRGEKRLMKLWNLFVMETKLIAEKQIPAACCLFVEKHRELLKKEKIDRNFLSHLNSLYDFGLIQPPIIEQCMMTLHEEPPPP